MLMFRSPCDTRKKGLKKAGHTRQSSFSDVFNLGTARQVPHAIRGGKKAEVARIAIRSSRHERYNAFDLLTD